MSQRCSECGVKKDELCRCTGCYHVQYCSRKCQKKHWRVHKADCEARRPELTPCGQDCEAQEDKSTPGGQDCGAHEDKSTPGGQDFDAQKGETHAVGLDTTSPFVIDHVQLCAPYVKNWAAAASSIGSDKTAVKRGANKPKDEDGCASGRPRDVGICCYCGNTEITRTCSQCKIAKYCGKTCQRKDWPNHRRACFEQDDADDFTESEMYKQDKCRYEHIFAASEEMDKYSREGYTTINISTNSEYGLRISPEKMRMCAKRPVGSVAIATELASSYFPGKRVIDTFDEMPFDNAMRPFQYRMQPHVVVAFIFRYHFDACRHAVYIQDKREHINRVDFYLDGHGGNPAPYFHYSEVRPGNYICLEGATSHCYMDGTFGIKMEDPRRVRIIGNEMLH